MFTVMFPTSYCHSAESTEIYENTLLIISFPGLFGNQQQQPSMFPFPGPLVHHCLNTPFCGMLCPLPVLLSFCLHRLPLHNMMFL